MRLSTLASVAVIALSSAALAQVHSGHGEQKVGGMNEMEAAANTATPANGTAEPSASDTASAPDANAASAAPPAGDPANATSVPPRG